MSATRYASILDLGFGDSGKGRFVDVLVRRWRAHTVVRFCGGAQAGHTVAAPAAEGNGARHHTFAQFGAGTFVPGTRTVLLDPFVLHPTALLVEAQVLSRCGVTDALSRLAVDGRCRITTPFHQAAGRLREIRRGREPHGTCGVGVGETVRQSLEHPAHTIRYADLAGPESAVLEKLHAQREGFLSEFGGTSAAGADAVAEMHVLKDESVALRWLGAARALARQRPPASLDSLRAQLCLPGSVIFEGAQGILLDEWRGFHPHTTWSSTTPGALEAATQPFGLPARIEHHGVIRTYLTRHGSGPFPTEDPRLEAWLPEPHNHSGGWQGRFRRGHPDAVLLRYALDAAPGLVGLLVSHMDALERGAPLLWCERYAVGGSSPGVDRLPLGECGDLTHQSRLTRLLFEALPHYSAQPLASAGDFLDRVASVTDLPVVLTSHGREAEAVRGSL